MPVKDVLTESELKYQTNAPTESPAMTAAVTFSAARSLSTAKAARPIATSSSSACTSTPLLESSEMPSV